MDTPAPDPLVLYYVGPGRFGTLPARHLTQSECAAWLPTEEERAAALASGCYSATPPQE